MSDYLPVPRSITQEQADCVGCTPEQYIRIVALAALFVPADYRVVHFTVGQRPPLYFEETETPETVGGSKEG